MPLAGAPWDADEEEPHLLRNYSVNEYAHQCPIDIAVLNTTTPVRANHRNVRPLSLLEKTLAVQPTANTDKQPGGRASPLSWSGSLLRKVLDHRPHLVSVPRAPVVACRQPRRPGAEVEGDHPDRQLS